MAQPWRIAVRLALPELAPSARLSRPIHVKSVTNVKRSWQAAYSTGQLFRERCSSMSNDLYSIGET